MYKYAEIINGKVAIICEDERTLEVIGKGIVDLTKRTLIDITQIPWVELGYNYDGVNFNAPIIPEPAPMTTEELVEYYESIVENHLDEVAKQRGYKDIVSLCSYKGSTDPIFNKEGTAGVAWRDQVWRKCYSIRDEFMNGIRTIIPTVEELIAELPVFTWGD